MKYYNLSLKEYLDKLAQREPVPGGGSAAAYTAALGAALISMVANYSVGKSHPKDNARFKKIIQMSNKFKDRLMKLADLDSQAYLRVSQSRKKGGKVHQQALQKASQIPLEVCHLCYQAIDLTPFLVEKGNKNLIADVKIAAELLLAAFNSAACLTEH